MAIYLAAEAWRQAYGQIATQRDIDESTSLQTCKLPSGITVVLLGWHEKRRGDADVFVGPDGEELDSLQLAAEQVERSKKGRARSESAAVGYEPAQRRLAGGPRSRSPT